MVCKFIYILVIMTKKENDTRGNTDLCRNRGSGVKGVEIQFSQPGKLTGPWTTRGNKIPSHYFTVTSYSLVNCFTINMSGLLSRPLYCPSEVPLFPTVILGPSTPSIVVNRSKEKQR